jgi:large subunit ribosomal protein L2
MANFLLRGLKLHKSSKGRTFLRTRSGRNFRLFRFIDFRCILSLYLPVIFCGYENDPFRNSYLGLFIYINGIVTYRIGSESLKIFSFFNPFFYEKEKKIFPIGQVIPLEFLKGGSFIHNLPFFYGSMAKMCRSAGLFLQLMRNDFIRRLSYVRIRRGFDIIFDINTVVIVGKVCNHMVGDFLLGSAGAKRRKGYRPIVRGIAMNPVDHPNGGRTPGGKVYRSYANRIARSTLKTSTRLERKNKFISYKKLS